MVRWVIGDIHGMLRALRSLVKAIDQADAGARLYFTGDYVNRGPDSRGVIDFLLTLDRARFARGNHDDVFELVLGERGLDPQLTGNDRLFALRWFSEYGILDTLESYGLPPARVTRAAQENDPRSLDRLLTVVTAEHRKFLGGLEPVIEQPDCFIAHAKWPVETPATGRSITDLLGERPEWVRILLWGRFTVDELFAEKAWGKRGYFGHTPGEVYQNQVQPVAKPLFARQMVLVDTGVALAEHGRLSAVCVDTHAVIQSDRDGVIHAYQGPAPDRMK
jgi:hypothetical protein